ncbi:MAG: CarD family transcriptional regulator [Chloroflexota bacterium]|nr:CarD family transcriptional regulator [Chloroflexota bacterium]
MTKITLELSEGDWIVHNRHGLGQIKGMDTKELLGDKKVFYVVKTDSITYWLPIAESGSDRIRPVATSKAFEEAKKILMKAPKALNENFRRRLSYIQEKSQDSDLMTKAALIRDMHARDVQKDVHINERKILDTLKRQFVNEWMAACKLSREEAETELDQALEKSVSKIKEK